MPCNCVTRCRYSQWKRTPPSRCCLLWSQHLAWRKEYIRGWWSVKSRPRTCSPTPIRVMEATTTSGLPSFTPMHRLIAFIGAVQVGAKRCKPRRKRKQIRTTGTIDLKFVAIVLVVFITSRKTHRLSGFSRLLFFCKICLSAESPWNDFSIICVKSQRNLREISA